MKKEKYYFKALAFKIICHTVYIYIIVVVTIKFLEFQKNIYIYILLNCVGKQRSSLAKAYHFIVLNSSNQFELLIELEVFKLTRARLRYKASQV